MFEILKGWHEPGTIISNDSWLKRERSFQQRSVSFRVEDESKKRVSGNIIARKFCRSAAFNKNSATTDTRVPVACRCCACSRSSTSWSEWVVSTVHRALKKQTASITYFHPEAKIKNVQLFSMLYVNFSFILIILSLNKTSFLNTRLKELCHGF